VPQANHVTKGAQAHSKKQANVVKNKTMSKRKVKGGREEMLG